MKCSDCKENLYHLFDYGQDALATELKEHISGCQQCYEEYEEMMDVVALLKPKAAVIAPESTKANVLSQIETAEKQTKVRQMNTSLKWLSGIAAAVALAIFLPMLFGKKNNMATANSYLNTVIEAMDKVRTMVLRMQVRTDDGENFAYIDASQPMKEHVLYKEFSPQEKWCIEKPGRTAFMKNDTTYVLLDNGKQAFFMKGKAYGMAEWFRMLFNPSNIIRSESMLAGEKQSKVVTKETDEEIHMTIVSKAKGTFINNVGRDKSINESDNRREYIFDKKTNLLKSLKVFLLKEEKEILIVNVSSVQYDIAIDPLHFSTTKFKDYAWQEIKAPEKDESISRLTPEQVARFALEDLSKEDFDTHKSIWGFVNKVAFGINGNRYAGCEIIEVGTAFQSGDYPGYYVPYKIKFKDGNIKIFQIAVRNDNPNKVWLVDGGI